jgi:tetratricopeptide (TPR) repeat protein
MKKKIMVPFGLALCALIQIVSAQDKNVALLNEYSTLSDRIEKAEAALKRGDLEKCEQEALACLGRLPEHHEAHLLMTQVFYKRGEYGPALEHVRAAEEGYLKLTEAMTVLEQKRMKAQTDSVAGLIDDVQNYTAADQAAKSRGSCQPDRYSKDLEDAKNKLIKEGRWTDKDPGQAMTQVPADYHFLHGNCLFRLKRLPEAEAEYLLAVKINPDYSEAYNNLINLMFMEKRLDEARSLLSQAEAHKASIQPGLKKAVLEAR